MSLFYVSIFTRPWQIRHKSCHKNKGKKRKEGGYDFDVKKAEAFSTLDLVSSSLSLLPRDFHKKPRELSPPYFKNAVRLVQDQRQARPVLRSDYIRETRSASASHRPCRTAS